MNPENGTLQEFSASCTSGFQGRTVTFSVGYTPVDVSFHPTTARSRLVARRSCRDRAVRNCLVQTFLFKHSTCKHPKDNVVDRKRLFPPKDMKVLVDKYDLDARGLRLSSPAWAEFAPREAIRSYCFGS